MKGRMPVRGPRCLQALAAGAGRKSIFAKEGVDSANIQAWCELAYLELIQFHCIQKPILVDIGDFEYPPERFRTFRLQDVFPRIVERSSGMQNGFLRKVENFGYV
jgi:hypothetical protein